MWMLQWKEETRPMLVQWQKKLALKAQELGVLKVARKWLNQSIMFKFGKSKQGMDQKDIRLNVFNIDSHPSYDDVTGIYEAKYKCLVELDPVMSLSGIITGIEGGYSLATSHIAIEFNFSPEKDTYFVIAKKNEFSAGDYYQVVGLGRIYNNIDKVSQGEILTSDRGINIGDMFFLLKTNLMPVVEKKIERPNESKLPVVKVHPILEKRENGPKEMK